MISRFVIVLPIVAFVCFVLLGSFVVRGQRPEQPTLPNQDIKPIVAPTTRQISRPQRIREGTAFKDTHVFFRQTGDRTVLYTVGDNQRFTCLENLTLERILATIQANPERQYWRIEGEYTEFRGDNFVLIRRAVVAQAPAAAPTLPPVVPSPSN
jgi:hypothetical protein